MDFKTHGSGRLRKLRTGALVSTLALTTLGMGTMVSADEVSTPTETQVQAQQTQTQEQTQPVTQQMVDDAGVVAQEAGRSVVVAQADLDQAQANLASIQEARSEVSSVTEADVAQAQAEVQENQQTHAQAQADSVRASEAVQTTEKALETVRTQEAQAQADHTSAKTAQEEAQARVDKLQEGTSLADLQKQVQADQEAVDLAQAALKAAQEANQDSKALEEALAKAETRVESTAAAYQTALNEVNATQADLSKAKSALDASATRTEKVQVGTETITTGGKATLNKGVATSSVFKTNGIITTDAYLQALKNLANGTGTADEVTAAINKGYRKNSLLTLNGANNAVELLGWRDLVGMSVATDGNDPEVFADALTEEQLTDLALFYTALVNDVRSKVGTSPLVVTEESMQVAKDLIRRTFDVAAPGYAGMTHEERLANNFFPDLNKASINSFLGFHYTSNLALSRVEIPNGFASITPDFNNYYTTHRTKKQPLSHYKLNLFRLVANDLFVAENVSGSTKETDYKQALRLLGLDDSDVKSVGVAFDYLEFSQGTPHYDPTALLYLSTNPGTPIPNPYQTLTNTTTQEVPVYEERPVAADPALQLAYDNALKASNQAQAEAQEAKMDADRALEDYKTLKEAQKGTVDIPTLEENLAQAQARLQADQEALATLSQSDADRAKALKEAQADLAQAQADLQQALQTLETAQDQLQRVGSANEVAKMAFAKAQSDLLASEKALQASQANHQALAEQLQNKGMLLADLDNRLAQANQELQKAQEALDKAQATYSEANTYYLTLLAAFQANQANQNKVQDLANQAKDIQDKGGVVVPVVDQNGTIQGVVDGSAFPDAQVGDIVTLEGIKYRLNADGTVSVVTVENGNVTNMGTNQGNGQGTPVALDYKVASNFDRKDGAKVLPNTGSQDSSAMVLGMVGLMATLALVKSRKRKN